MQALKEGRNLIQIVVVEKNKHTKSKSSLYKYYLRSVEA